MYISYKVRDDARPKVCSWHQPSRCAPAYGNVGHGLQRDEDALPRADLGTGFDGLLKLMLSTAETSCDQTNQLPRY